MDRRADSPVPDWIFREMVDPNIDSFLLLEMGVWQSRDGERRHISQMTDSHINRAWLTVKGWDARSGSSIPHPALLHLEWEMWRRGMLWERPDQPIYSRSEIERRTEERWDDELQYDDGCPWPI